MTPQTIMPNADGTLTVTLSTGDRYILREPLGKDMIGLAQDLIQIKHTETVQKLLAKISTPPMTSLTYAKLPLSDTQVLNAAVNFFTAPPSAKAEMMAALSELGYLSESNTTPTTSPE